jgi:hypothetical protein
MTAHPISDWPTAPIDTPTASTEGHLYAVAAGVSVPAILASASASVGADWLAAIAVAGIPIGAVLAAEGANRMTGPDWSFAALRAGIIAPLVAGLAIAAFWAIGGLMGLTTGWGSTGPEAVVGVLAGVIAFGAVSVIAALIIGLPITVPAAFVTTLILRWAVSVDRPVARIAVTALVALAVGLGMLTLGERGLPW